MIIKLASPLIEQEAIDNVNQVLHNEWLSTGPYVKELEEYAHQFTDRKYNIALNSCTAALHIASWLLNIKPGDEVIVPSMTFIASITGILQCGGIPIIVDVDPDTFLLTEDIVKKYITNKTKAILVMHYAGRPVDLDSWTIDLPIIEDCAQASGTILPKRQDTLRCFSFHAVKTLTGGVGGMISTNNEKFAERSKSFRWVGIKRDTFSRSQGSYISDYDIEELGLNYYMCNINAAIIMGQLKHFKEQLQIRKNIANYYYNNLSNKIKKQNIQDSSNYIYPICYSKRDDLMSQLNKLDIETGIHHRPLHTFPIVQNNCIIKDVTNVNKEWKNLLSIPLHCKMTLQDVQLVTNSINQIIL